MDRILRFAAAAALGLAFAAPPALADSHGGVTVGGWIEVIGGSTDNDEAGSVDGFSRGVFSRIAVSYDDTLDNGLTVAGRAAYQLNQRGSGVNVTQSGLSSAPRMDAATNFAPDVLYISVGGGFGTVNVGAHAGASCAVLPRPIAFVNGVDQGHYNLFTGVEVSNGTFSEANYCATAESLSYSTPTVGGLKATFTFAPDNESNQGTDLKQARSFEEGGLVGDEEGQGISNIENRIDIAASWSTTMGAMNVSVGAGYQQGGYQAFADNDFRSTTIAATVGFGALTFGASWFDNETAEAASEWDACSAVQRAEDAIDFGNGAGGIFLPGDDVRNVSIGDGDGGSVDTAQNKLAAAYWDLTSARGVLDQAQRNLATEKAKTTPNTGEVTRLEGAETVAKTNVEDAEAVLKAIADGAMALPTAPMGSTHTRNNYLEPGTGNGVGLAQAALSMAELAALRSVSGLECYNGKSTSANQDGYTLAAKYDVGNLTLGTTWSTMETDETGLEESALVLGASYSMGGGLTTWLEYMDLTVDPSEGEKLTDDIILVGVTLGF